jgi:hypothetical protein
MMQQAGLQQQMHHHMLQHMALPNYLLAVLLMIDAANQSCTPVSKLQQAPATAAPPHPTAHHLRTHLLAVLLAMRLSERLVSARSPRMLPTTACSCCRLLLSDDAASDCAAPAVRLLSASQVVNAVST